MMEHPFMRISDAIATADKARSARAKLPTITVLGWNRHLAAQEGIAALYAAGAEIYQRDRKLVRACKIKARAVTGEEILVPGIAEMTIPTLEAELAAAAKWQRPSRPPKEKDATADRTPGFTAIDPPTAVTRQALSRDNIWPFPTLRGVIACPTLRPDGRLLAEEGFDPQTGLVLYSTVAVPPIPERRADAEAAIAALDSLLAEFPFVDGISRAVALSGLLTPVLRGAMPVAPLHLITAPEAGTGKSFLVDVISTLATGERAAVTAVAPNPEETEKRLVGAALAGSPIISLDNCRDTLAGDFLCQVTERPLLQLRALGKSDVFRVANTFTMFATGNNVAVADDMVRRAVRCALDANTEAPELRQFTSNPLVRIQRHRGIYICAALTVARAYIAAGRPGRLPPLASYEAWSDLVRSALVWLGFDDPAESMANARDLDPVRQTRAMVFEAWLAADLRDRPALLAPEIVELAEARHGYNESLVRPQLYAALLEVAAKRGDDRRIDPRRLGRWLADNENTIAAGGKLVVDRSDKKRPRYRVVAPR